MAADLDSPPFRKALVDGFAVRAADLGHCGGRFALGMEVPAGRTPDRPLAPGNAALVMTGAPLPDGADAIVMREAADLSEPGFVTFDPSVSIASGLNWLRRGREMGAGEVVLRAGQRLTPARIGLLATVGRAEVPAIPRPRVAVVPTGDELVEPDRVPGPGQIRNSNAAMLRALAESWGAEAWTLPIAPDEPGALRSILAEGLESADVLLVAGGVSEGDRDLVPAALVGLGVAPVFHKVRLKPGKPLWFGVGQGRGDAGLRAAGEPRRCAGGGLAVRQAGARNPPGIARGPGRAIRGEPCLAVRASRGQADVSSGDPPRRRRPGRSGRAAKLGRLGGLADGGECRRFCNLPGGRPGLRRGRSDRLPAPGDGGLNLAD